MIKRNHSGFQLESGVTVTGLDRIFAAAKIYSVVCLFL